MVKLLWLGVVVLKLVDRWLLNCDWQCFTRPSMVRRDHLLRGIAACCCNFFYYFAIVVVTHQFFLAPFMLHTWWLLNQQRDFKLTCLGFVLEAGFPWSKIVRWVVERDRGSSTISVLGWCYFFFFAVIAHIKSFHFDVGWSMWLSRCGGWKWWQPSFSLGTGGGQLLTVSMYFIAALESFLSFGLFMPSSRPFLDIFL